LYIFLYLLNFTPSYNGLGMYWLMRFEWTRFCNAYLDFDPIRGSANLGIVNCHYFFFLMHIVMIYMMCNYYSLNLNLMVVSFCRRQ